MRNWSDKSAFNFRFQSGLPNRSHFSVINLNSIGSFLRTNNILIKIRFAEDSSCDPLTMPWCINKIRFMLEFINYRHFTPFHLLLNRDCPFIFLVKDRFDRFRLDLINNFLDKFIPRHIGIPIYINIRKHIDRSIKKFHFFFFRAMDLLIHHF